MDAGDAPRYKIWKGSKPFFTNEDDITRAMGLGGFHNGAIAVNDPVVDMVVHFMMTEEHLKLQKLDKVKLDVLIKLRV